MSTVLGFDQLNTLYKPRAVDYETYFGEMELTEEQKEQRIGFAEAIEEELATTLAVLAMVFAYGMLHDVNVYRQRLVERYAIIASRYTDDYDWIWARANEFADDFIDSTKRNQEDAWYFSDDRAMFNAENEANTVLNFSDYADALLSGKKNKQWIDMKDDRERKSHLKVGGTIIPIEDYFEVGNSLMLFPHDPNGDAEELINCRCQIRYF